MILGYLSTYLRYLPTFLPSDLMHSPDLMRSQDYELVLNFLSFLWEEKRKQLKTAQKFGQIIRKRTVWISGSFIEIYSIKYEI